MFKQLISYASVLIIFSFLIGYIYSNWYLVSQYKWNFTAVNLSLLVIFLLPINFINASSWYLLTKGLGSNVGFFQSLKVWIFSNLSRFLPGVIWQYAGRFYLATKVGTPKAIVSVALILEGVLNMMVGFIVIMIVVFYWQLSLSKEFINILFVLGFILFLMTVIFSNQNLTKKILFLVIKVANLLGKKTTLGLNEVLAVSLSKRLLPLILVSYLMQFIFDGSVLFFLARGAADLPLSLYPLFIGVFAVSWLIGYLAFFAPSGLGIQEVSLSALLSLYMPFPIAILVAVTFRILLYISEIISVVVIHFMAKSKKTKLIL